jgi:hypothetical protein
VFISVIVNKLNVMYFAILPFKAKSVLIVDTNAPLALAVAFERFQPVCRRDVEVLQARYRVKLKQLSVRGLCNRVGYAFYKLAIPDGLGDLVRKGSNHLNILSNDDSKVNSPDAGRARWHSVRLVTQYEIDWRLAASP